MASSNLGSSRQSAQQHLEALALHWEARGGLGIPCAYSIRSGGKRLRPTIAIALGRQLLESQGLFRSSFDEALCRAAIGVELLHLASLIADDLPCMDDDDERRGMPTVHRQFGESTAILASYALIAHGYELLAASAARAAHPARAIEAVARIAGCGGLEGACEGQFLDLELAAGRQADRMRMLQLKTGALFEMAFICGWGFGGESLADASAIRKLATSFGLAFQCLDDLVDCSTDGAENCVGEWGLEGVLSKAQKQFERFQHQLESLGWSTGAMQELSYWLESSLDRVVQTPAVSSAKTPISS